MTLSPDPIAGTSAGGNSLPPPEQQVSATVAEPPMAPMLPRGSIWSAQIGAIGAHDFVLLVAGMPFEIPGTPPAGEGQSLVVRVADDGGSPVFVVLTHEPEVHSAAVRALLSHVLRRALAPTPSEARAHTAVIASSSSPEAIADSLRHAAARQLATPSHDVVRFLETGVIRLDLTLPDAPHTGWHVDVHDAPGRGANGQKAVTATLFVELPSSGPVEARLSLAHGSLHVGLVTANEDVCHQLQGGVEDLRLSLNAAGFHAVQIGVEADPGRLARDRVTDDAPRDMPTSGGLLDIRA